MDNYHRPMKEAFRDLLRLEDALDKACQDDTLFIRFIRTGTNEYGVQAAMLALTVKVPFEAIFAWQNGKDLPASEDRENILRAMADLVARDLDKT